MSSILYFLIWAVIVIWLMRFGYGAHIMGHGKSQPSDGKATGQGGTEGLRWIPPAKDVDPVCSKTVNTDKARPSVHDGRVYYFCSRECRERFEATPEQYVESQRRNVPSQLENNHA